MPDQIPAIALDQPRACCGSLRYRARLIDPGNANQERPVVTYGNDWRKIEEWAGTVLGKALSPSAVVEVFETFEQRVKVFAKRPNSGAAGAPGALHSTVGESQ